ncbi:hypothetical protein MTO96_039693, partial [Rhipicephalus appendiculatus]
FRHPTATTVSRTARVLSMLLGIVAKPHKRDKFEVTPESVAYLAALVSVSEEVRSRCHLKHRVSTRVASEALARTPPSPVPTSLGTQSASSSSSAIAGASSPSATGAAAPSPPTFLMPAGGSSRRWGARHPALRRRARTPSSGEAWTLARVGGRPLFRTQRSSSMPTPRSQKGPPGTAEGDAALAPPRSSRVSVSNEDNVLLDPEVLTDFPTQALVLTVLATLVRFATDENETRILYEYLAEASVVFPKVFPVIHSLLDAKITTVLSQNHDHIILSAVQCIIQNMIACEDSSQQQLHYLQSALRLWGDCGGLLALSPRAKPTWTMPSCLSIAWKPWSRRVCRPTRVSSASTRAPCQVASAINLSSSMSSLTLASPTDKDGGACSDGGGSAPTPGSGAPPDRARSASQLSKQRSFKCKNPSGSGAPKSGRTSH